MEGQAYEDLRVRIETRATELHKEVAEWQAELLNELETAKQNEILTALKQVTVRLDKIEAHLEAEQE